MSHRRNSESIVHAADNKLNRTVRRMSLFDRRDSKDVSFTHKYNKCLKETASPTEIREECVSLPRIPSVTPEPDIIRLKGQKDIEPIELPELSPANTYKPKYCWCLRCQLMFTMFRTGDPHLENWGNYPCFQR